MGQKDANFLVICKVAFSYVGSIVGAGFASGQELMQFFAGLQSGIIPALILVTILFAAFGWSTLYLSRIYQTANYGQFLDHLFGDYLFGVHVARVFDLLIALFLFSGLGIMLSAAGAVFEEHFRLPFQFGVILLSISVIIILISNRQGLLWINTLLMPAKMIIIIMVSVMVISISPCAIEMGGSANLQIEPVSNSWMLTSLLYVSYNLIIGLAVLASLGAADWDARITQAGIWGGLVLGLFAGGIVGALMCNWPLVASYQIPMLHLVEQVHPGVKGLYMLILCMGILTTAVACAYSFTVRLTKLTRLPYFYILCVILILAIILAQQGFSYLIQIIYPLFGYVGFILLISLIWRTIEVWCGYGIPKKTLVK